MELLDIQSACVDGSVTCLFLSPTKFRIPWHRLLVFFKKLENKKNMKLRVGKLKA